MIEQLQAEIDHLRKVNHQLTSEVLQLQAKLDNVMQGHVHESVGLLEQYHDKLVNAETVIALQQIEEMKKGGE